MKCWNVENDVQVVIDEDMVGVHLHTTSIFPAVAPSVESLADGVSVYRIGKNVIRIEVKR